MVNISVALVGAPVETGAGRPGCLMGPDALRTAGLASAIRAMGCTVQDFGNVSPAPATTVSHRNPAIRNLGETCAWAEALSVAAYQAARQCDLPIFLGGDHSLSIGTVAGVARHSAELGRPQYVLWLDAHSDLHNLESTQSGNLHGTPVAYLSGQAGFGGTYPPFDHPVPPKNICLMGLRSVDPHERSVLASQPFATIDMRKIDEAGVIAPLDAFLSRVEADQGALHVSLDVDFLDPSIAPAVGTTVPGGATFREAHLIMEMLSDRDLVTSLDLVELNPFLDDRGRTATLLVDLCASLLGRKVLDRPTRAA